MTLTQIFIYTMIAGAIITGASYALRKPANPFISFLRNFLGSFMIFSGFVKAIDPLGTAYKMHDYFIAFGGFFTSLDPLTVPMAVFMIVLELVLGVALILGAYRKITAWLTFAIILFFTFLTGYTYLNGYVNPDYYNAELVAEKEAAGETVPFIVEFNKNNMKVTDCGCFGDFLKLDPKISFFKDIFLMIVIIIFIMMLSSSTPLFENNLPPLIILGVTTVFSLIFCFSNYVTDIPAVDFRPYKVGNNIPQQMIPEKEDSIVYTFVYKNENTDEVGEFSVTNLPKAADGWKFQERKEVVVVEGIPAKINNFLVLNEDGEDINSTLLEDEKYNFWIVAYSLEKTNEKAFKEKVNAVAEGAMKDGYQAFALASDANDAFRHDVQAAYPFYTADATFLKTIVRSNPGVVLVKNGVVIEKWHHKHLPSYEEIKSNYLK